MNKSKPGKDVKKPSDSGKAPVRRDWFDPMNFPLIVNRYL